MSEAPALFSDGKAYERLMGRWSQVPGSEVTRQANMQALWEKAGLQSVETRAIRIRVEFSGFDDFWDSNSAPVGPSAGCRVST